MSSFISSASSAAPASWLDRAGIVASVACLVHCMITPVLLSFSAVLAQILPGEASVHRPLAVSVALLGAMAVVRGFRTHRRWLVVMLLLAGLVAICFGAWWGDRLPRHWMEVLITMTGSCLLVCAHRLNHTFCKQCVCAAGCGAGDNR